MADNAASFGVAIATMGRTEQLAELLQSISESTVLPSEIVIVDQNEDDRLVPVVARFPGLSVQHHRVPFKGLSAARNYAATVVTTDVMFTPDDDCRVYPETFGAAIAELERTGADVVFGKCVDESGADSIAPFRTAAAWLTRERFDGMFVEPATALKTSVLRDIPFDETLGVGRFHGAEEGYDWVLRLLEAGKRLRFQPAIRFFHPQTITDYGSSQARRRVFYYRSGYGRLCRKHGLWGKYMRRVALVAGGIVAYSVTDRAKARYYLAELSGLIAGVTVEP